MQATSPPAGFCTEVTTMPHATPLGEFELIQRFFTRSLKSGSPVRLGVGDDCALVQPRPGYELAISTDMLVEGRHFLSTVDPARLGHKALAVNLSDLAACGATPLGFTLALALPRADEAWLSGFSQGLLNLAQAHGCELIGGDTTQGPLNICITVFGEIPLRNSKSQALLRSGAQPGDDIYVSGTLGDARLALEVFRGTVQVPAPVFEAARERLEQPTPRIALGRALLGVASAACDISDGLSGDLGHILQRSGVGATLDARQAIQLLGVKRYPVNARGVFDSERALSFVLNGGDDYELVFTAPPQAADAVAAAAQASATPVLKIGRIDAEPGLRLWNGEAVPQTLKPAGFDHFK